jgi:hypothetical protein
MLIALAAPACGGDDSSSASDQTPSTATPAQGTIDKAKYSTRITNPFVAITPVPLTKLRGTDEGAKVLQVNRTLKKKAVVAGVRVTVLDNKEYHDGKLVEHTFDYFAQRPDGRVYYFGERVQNFEGGKVNHEGQWLAGQGKNKPGLYMPAHPKVGDAFDQERAPGVAEDRTTVLKAGLKRKTHAGTFNDCIYVSDYSPIDKNKEYKYYCAGVGLIHEDEAHAHLDLTSYKKR